MNTAIIIHLLGLLAVFAPADTGSAASCGMRISGMISGYAPGKPVHVALYASADDFARQRCFRKIRFKPEELPADGVRYIFENVCAGRYLVAAFQDMSGDRQFNKGFFGRPLEPYCLYRRHTGLFAPDFSTCSFNVDADVDSADLEFTIK